MDNINKLKSFNDDMTVAGVTFEYPWAATIARAVMDDDSSTSQFQLQNLILTKGFDTISAKISNLHNDILLERLG